MLILLYLSTQVFIQLTITIGIFKLDWHKTQKVAQRRELSHKDKWFDLSSSMFSSPVMAQQLGQIYMYTYEVSF